MSSLNNCNFGKYENGNEDQNIQLFVSVINTNNFKCLDHILNNNKYLLYEMYKKKTSRF